MFRKDIFLRFYMDLFYFKKSWDTEYRLSFIKKRVKKDAVSTGDPIMFEQIKYKNKHTCCIRTFCP